MPPNKNNLPCPCDSCPYNVATCGGCVAYDHWLNDNLNGTTYTDYYSKKYDDKETKKR